MCLSSAGSSLEKNGEVVRHQDGVVQEDNPLFQLPLLVLLAQHVFALRGDQVLLRIAAPRAVQQQVRPYRYLVFLLAGSDPDVGDEVAGVGGRGRRPPPPPPPPRRR